MNDLLGTLVALSIFHIVGGGFIGGGLRALRQGNWGNAVSRIVFGGLFGGMPLFIGVSQLLNRGMPYLFVAECAIFLGAIIIGAFPPNFIFETFKAPQVGQIALGGVFVLAGVFTIVISIKTEPLGGLFFGGIFAIAGAALVVVSVLGLLKS